MIARKRRISRNQFPDSRIRRVIFTGESILASYYINKSDVFTKACVVVSKKVSKKAVVRNVFKRTIYEQFRIQQQYIDKYCPGFIVFTPRNTQDPNWSHFVSSDMTKMVDKFNYEKTPYLPH